MDFPFLPESRIEAAAARLRADAFGSGAEIPVPLDLEVILFDHLYEKQGVVFRNDTDLGTMTRRRCSGKRFLSVGVSWSTAA